MPRRPSAQPRLPPVAVEEWERLRDDWGRISKENELKFKARVFYGVSDIVLRHYVVTLTSVARMHISKWVRGLGWSGLEVFCCSKISETHGKGNNRAT